MTGLEESSLEKVQVVSNLLKEQGLHRLEVEQEESSLVPEWRQNN